jgi:hypothetical protein
MSGDHTSLTFLHPGLQILVVLLQALDALWPGLAAGRKENKGGFVTPWVLIIPR